MINEQIVSPMLAMLHIVNAARRMAVMTRTRRLRQKLLRSRFVSAASCCGDRTGAGTRLVFVLEGVTSILRDLEYHYRYRKYLFKSTERRLTNAVVEHAWGVWVKHGAPLIIATGFVVPNYSLIGSPMHVPRLSTGRHVVQAGLLSAPPAGRMHLIKMSKIHKTFGSSSRSILQPKQAD